ncbi:MAG TPA: GNAT family N-acetyltransferase [Actinophytocola sp.]|uniref:GNAT family N-acetyltransferase n=1 Tax=Actinophytocola sp. TaxID=1872138 RepID=UPI002DB87B9E|nr:GNAT family N-acetyltransferase [Actinophytocola sp.]HEU5473804.1 GNAT family N-acetyltransferase [Actinophytocola sp.]
MIVQRLGPDDWRTWREVRLAALADAPYAYGSTYAREARFDESEWRARLAPDNGMTAVALDATVGIGAIGIYLLPETGAALLIAAWVAPAARGRGIGDALVAEALRWAREHGHQQVSLRVADGNQPARRLFLRTGFVPTGQRIPLESDPAVGTEVLVRKLSDPADTVEPCQNPSV